MTRVSIVLPIVAGISIAALAQTPTPATPAPAKQTCNIERRPPTEADDLLARKAYPEAEAKYKASLAADPTSQEAHLGIVRAYIGEDKVTEALAEAATTLQHSPQSAIAEVASSEAAFRSGDPDAAFAHAKAAAQDDPCEGRAFTAIADVYDLNAFFAKSASLIDRAHRLRPTDELVRRDWIDSLPRKRRQAELERYLPETKDLSVDDLRNYTNELGHLKATRPGECRITSKAETVKTKLQFVFGDSSHPEAFGLDVFFDSKRRRMQIDTGASGIVLSASAAKGLGLTPEYHLKTGGVGDDGDVNSYLAHVQQIRIGDVELSDCMVEVIEKSKLDVDGLIGMDVFRRWLVTLDYQAAELRLSPLPARPGELARHPAADSNPMSDDVAEADDVPHDKYIAPDMQDFGQIIRIGHEILLPAFVTKEKVHYLLMDTGAGQSALNLPMAREAGKLHGSDVEFTGISGKVKKVFEVDQVPLTVGNLHIPPSTMYAWDITSISHDAGFEISGFLGLPTLQRLAITIDYRDNLLKLKYDPNHDKQRF